MRREGVVEIGLGGEVTEVMWGGPWGPVGLVWTLLLLSAGNAAIRTERLLDLTRAERTAPAAVLRKHSEGKGSSSSPGKRWMAKQS